MASEEELESIKKKLGKIRGFENKDGSITFAKGAEEALQDVSSQFDIIRDNFDYFLKSYNFMAYPHEFIFAIEQLEGGKQLIFDNIDAILSKNNARKEQLISELTKIDGIGEVLASDLDKRFNLIFSQSKLDSSERFAQQSNYSYDACSSDEKYKYSCVLQAILGCENAPEIIEKYKHLFINSKFNSMMPELLDELLERPEFTDFVRENFQEIRDSAMEKDIVSIYKRIKTIYPEEYQKHQFIIEQIYDPAMSFIEKEDWTEDDDYITTNQTNNTCGRIISHNRDREIETLIKYMSPSGEFQVASVGGCAIVLEAGERFLKVGGDRLDNNDFEIINHPRILRPIIRKKDISVDPKRPLYIEIQDAVDVESEISDEELLMVYKEFREAGLKWCDVKKNNLGRLKKPNYGYPIGAGVPNNNASLGLVGPDSLEGVLMPGDIVMFDLSMLYREDNVRATLNPQAPAYIVEFEREFMKKQEEAEKQENTENKDKKNDTPTDGDYGNR